MKTKYLSDGFPLTGVIGIELPSVEIRELDENGIDELRVLVSTHCVAVARRQFLTPQELLAFGERLGPLASTPGLKHNTDIRHLQRIENRGKANAATENWHTDASFAEKPAAYTVLTASVLPIAGGDTLFINQYQSYARLSPAFRSLLKGLRAEHFNAEVVIDSDRPRQIHPIVRLHPITRDPALFVNVPISMGLIDNFSESESRNLISFLYEESLAIDRMYRHRWLDGDVVIWDNRCTLHAAAHDYGDEERTLYRVMTSGEIPVGLVDS